MTSTGCHEIKICSRSPDVYSGLFLLIGIGRKMAQEEIDVVGSRIVGSDSVVYTRSVWQVRGLEAVRQCYGEGGGDCYANL
jgi:hypothetical protein